jgi:hypothetical protein
MAENEMFVQSLRNRIRAMNTLWERALSDLTLDQMNHHERAGVLPMAFSFGHFMRMQDQSVSGAMLGRPPLWLSGGWASKVAVTVDAMGREESVEEMELLRFGDLDAWREYQSAVIAQTSALLETVDEAVLSTVVVPKLPPNAQQIFCALVIGPDAPLRKLEVLECFVYQHGLRHMGEVEHGRALVGLGGMTS